MQLIGVGYKAEKKGKTLVLNLGYSHPIEMTDPEGITTEVPSATEVVVKGYDKALVGNYAANIRKWRKPKIIFRFRPKIVSTYPCVSANEIVESIKRLIDEYCVK